MGYEAGKKKGEALNNTVRSAQYCPITELNNFAMQLLWEFETKHDLETQHEVLMARRRPDVSHFLLRSSVGPAILGSKVLYHNSAQASDGASFVDFN